MLICVPADKKITIIIASKNIQNSYLGLLFKRQSKYVTEDGGYWDINSPCLFDVSLTVSFIATKERNVSITYFHSLEGLFKSIGSSKHGFKPSGAVSQTPSLFMLFLSGILLQY